MKLIFESENGVMLKTIISDGEYYLIKSATRNKSFWNKSISYVNEFAKEESAIKKLYTILNKLPDNAFYDSDDIFDIEDESDLKKAKFAQFFITDTNGKVIRDISNEVKKYLLSDDKFISAVLDDEDFDESLSRKMRIEEDIDNIDLIQKPSKEDFGDNIKMIDIDIMLNGIKIGYVELFISYDEDGEETASYIKSIEIKESYRNLGFGTEVLKRLAKDHNGIYICPDNKNAERLYARLGHETDAPEEFESELDNWGIMYYIQ